MDFVRKIINSDDLDAVLNLPKELRHKQVEVLVLPVEEESDKESFDPEKIQRTIRYRRSRKRNKGNA